MLATPISSRLQKKKKMSLVGRAEYEMEVSSPGDVFFEIFGRKKEKLPKICPKHVPVIDLLKGKWGETGCVILVHYLLGNLLSTTHFHYLFIIIHLFQDYFLTGYIYCRRERNYFRGDN